MPPLSRLVAVVGVGLAALGGTASFGPAPAPDSQPAAGAEPIVDGRLGDAAGLRAVLEALEYQPADGGGGNWLITRKQGEWEISVFLLLNADASVLWLKCFLGRIESPETYRIEHYLALLEEQGRISPRFFFTVPAEGGAIDLFFCRGLDNRALSAELIGREIALLQASMGECVQTWNFMGWTRAGEQAPDAGAPGPG